MLTLPIKKKWFDMILSGEKKEEYREIKPYYTSRFVNVFNFYPYGHMPMGLAIKKVMFRNGYSKNSPSFIAVCSLNIRTGKTEWGAEPGVKYYVLTIHEVLKPEGV